MYRDTVTTRPDPHSVVGEVDELVTIHVIRSSQWKCEQHARKYR
jgi:hypothetical protein